MPLYEEKLISPLALRFSVEHVRNTFGNSQALDDAVELLEESAGIGPYDIILKAPFPNIEVIRWAPPRKRSGIPDDRPHWFTKDNRRLYVLQRAASKLWPRKVAVEVDILFAGSELFRKYDSSTAGLLAFVRDSASGTALATWDWMKAVSPLTGDINMPLERAAHRQVLLDDAAGTLAELVSVPQDFQQELLLSSDKADADATSSTSSTSSGGPPDVSLPSPTTKSNEEKESAVEAVEAEAEEKPEAWQDWSLAEHWTDVSSLLQGTWKGPKGETYTMHFGEPSEDLVCGQCVRSQNSKQKTFSVRFESESCLLFWGTGRKFCLDPEELRETPKARWYVAGKDKPEFESCHADSGR